MTLCLATGGGGLAWLVVGRFHSPPPRLALDSMRRLGSLAGLAILNAGTEALTGMGLNKLRGPSGTANWCSLATRDAGLLSADGTFLVLSSVNGSSLRLLMSDQLFDRDILAPSRMPLICASAICNFVSNRVFTMLSSLTTSFS